MHMQTRNGIAAFAQNRQGRGVCVESKVETAAGGVLKQEKYTECLRHYPTECTEVVIKGGCHAYFGDCSAQMEITADAIAAMFGAVPG
ncbi:MAG: hypothetical protein IJ313_02780 [Clostridia bacterium]|nr:hypothetical protein [Clostridia bacterium]